MNNDEESIWVPKTQLGQEVSEGKISISEIFRKGRKIKEPEIVERLIPSLRNEIIFIGDSPGKGGGSRKTPTKRTARMHSSGRRFKISSLAIVGNENGYVGIGISSAKDNKTAIKKAVKNAKLNVIPVRRGCGSWECACNGSHSIPFAFRGKSGSVVVELKPAPKGIGLVISHEAKKLVRLAGISDIWSRSFGDTRSRINFMFALFDAFKKTNSMKLDYEPEDLEPVITGEQEEKLIEENKEAASEENKIEDDAIAEEIEASKGPAKKRKSKKASVQK